MNPKNTDCVVLIVDDNEHCQSLMRYSLYSSGIMVDCTSNGDEALLIMVEKKFSFMITDYNMPGMNGVELARKARAMAPDMPIILVTGDVSPEIPDLAREVGINKICYKPLNVNEILAYIRGR